MNTKKLILYVAAVLLAGSWSVNADSGKAPSEWKLIWADEFDKDGKPDPAKWKPENTGFLRNKEEQWEDRVVMRQSVPFHMFHLPGYRLKKRIRKQCRQSDK